MASAFSVCLLIPEAIRDLRFFALGHIHRIAVACSFNALC